MVFGDGDGDLFNRFTIAPDVIPSAAHRSGALRDERRSDAGEGGVGPREACGQVEGGGTCSLAVRDNGRLIHPARGNTT
jgi:hypothetical protein